MQLHKAFLAALFLAGLAVSARAQVTYTDNFGTNVDYLLNGVAGTIWDGVYLGAGEIASPTGNGTGIAPGSVSVADANLTSVSNLTIQSVYTDWENAADDGVFLFKVVTGDFDMSVRVVPPINAFLFNLQGLMVRAFGPGGSPLQPTNNTVKENSLLWARFDEFSIANMRKNNLNGVRTDTGLGVYPNSNYWLRIQRVGNTFNLYERALETDAWNMVGSQVRNDFNGVPLQVGIEHADFSAGVTRTGRYEKFSLTASAMGPFPAPPSPATGLKIVNTTDKADISWTPGAGSAGSLVAVWTGNPAGNPAMKQAPANGFTYTGNAIYGLGSTLPATNYFVVYSGAGTNVTITNLQPSTIYNVAVFSYVGSGATISYKNSPATGRFSTSSPPAQPVISQAYFSGDNFVLQISGDAGLTYLIQTSTNLTNWTTIYSNVPPNLPFFYADLNPPVQKLFYRALFLWP